MNITKSKTRSAEEIKTCLSKLRLKLKLTNQTIMSIKLSSGLETWKVSKLVIELNFLAFVPYFLTFQIGLIHQALRATHFVTHLALFFGLLGI